MLRQEPTRINSETNGFYPEEESNDSGSAIDVQTELDRLEEIILDSSRIPFTGLTLVEEEKLLDQLDLVRLNLPVAFKQAQSIIQYKDDIFRQAEEYAESIIIDAERKAEQILDELGIIRQAEREAAILRQRVQDECTALQEETVAEVERMRLQTRREMEQIRQAILSECEQIQTGADDYADQVLENIETQLNDMLRIIRNGRQQLETESFVVRNNREQ
jgi:hypothetical protein